MKPEFSKPFDAHHARQGAPFSCADGTAAAILKWDLRGGPCQIAGTYEDGQFGDELIRWTEDGTPHQLAGTAKTLVMLPLGLIDGKPVFVGDELVDPTGATFTPGPGNAGHLSGCRWPAPAKAYPKTTMTGADLISATGTGEWIDHSVIASIANAALRHAVDTGQVMAVDDVELAKSKSYLDGVHAVHAPSRAARDMLVAKAIRDVCMAKVDKFHNRAAQELFSVDLLSIINATQ